MSFKQAMINAKGNLKAITIHKMKDGDVLIQIEIFRPHYEELTYVVKANEANEARAEFTGNHQEYLEYKREIMEIDERSAAQEDD